MFLNVQDQLILAGGDVNLVDAMVGVYSVQTALRIETKAKWTTAIARGRRPCLATLLEPNIVGIDEGHRLEARRQHLRDASIG